MPSSITYAEGLDAAKGVAKDASGSAVAFFKVYCTLDKSPLLDCAPHADNASARAAALAPKIVSLERLVIVLSSGVFCESGACECPCATEQFTGIGLAVLCYGM